MRCACDLLCSAEDVVLSLQGVLWVAVEQRMVDRVAGYCHRVRLVAFAMLWALEDHWIHV